MIEVTLLTRELAILGRWALEGDRFPSTVRMLKCAPLRVRMDEDDLSVLPVRETLFRHTGFGAYVEE